MVPAMGSRVKIISGLTRGGIADGRGVRAEAEAGRHCMRWKVDGRVQLRRRVVGSVVSGRMVGDNCAGEALREKMLRAGAYMWCRKLVPAKGKN